MKESTIQETCCAWLALDGWRRIRTDMKQLRGMGVQEKGMADDLFIRYHGFTGQFIHAAVANPECQSQSEALWVEWKRERGSTSLNPKRALFTRAEKAMIHQKAWHAAERARGALTVILGEDCPATIEGFMDWYTDSGLLRKQGLRRKKAVGA